MAVKSENRKWLGTDADTPAGLAWDAVQRADYEELERIIREHATTCTGTAQGRLGHPVTALTAAARRADSKAVGMLLDAGAEPNVRASGNMIASPMQWAIEADSLGCVRLLGAALEKKGRRHPKKRTGPTKRCCGETRSPTPTRRSSGRCSATG